ncbi:MAG: arsenate reductase ArsC [Alphaproteobacteria bacterium]|nr:arsenate reductase ArsC [Alphaproteobacteria bacterium]
MQTEPQSVLFVCSENALRSPMAEAILKTLRGDRIFIDSAGVREGALDPLAVAVLAEIGIDLARHRPKRLEDLMDSSFDVVITLSPEAHHWALQMTRATAAEIEYWVTPDPSAVEGNRAVMLDAYRSVRDALMARIGTRFAPGP